MPPKGKAVSRKLTSLQRKKLQTDNGREDKERSKDQNEVEEGSDLSEGSAAGPSTGKRTQSQTYAFSSADEEKMVEFFAKNDAFYNKASPKYSNTSHKKKLLEALARDLDTEFEKIEGWFKNQRTAVGKLYKRKSGQAAESLTPRGQWQLKNFSFLKQHIVPRSYTQDTGLLPSKDIKFGDDEDAMCEDGDDDAPTDVNKAGCSSSAVTPHGSNKRSRKSNLEGALLDYLSRPRASQTVFDKLGELQSQQSPLDERAAFGKWFCARLTKVPDERWDDFQDAAQNLLKNFTRSDRADPQMPSVPSQQFMRPPWIGQWPQQYPWSQWPQQPTQWIPPPQGRPQSPQQQPQLQVAQTTSQSEEINLPPLSDSFMTMLQGTPNKEQLEQRENEDSDVHNK